MPRLERERRIDRIEHRDLDGAPAPGALAVEQRGDDAAIEMHAGEEIAQRRAGLHRRRDPAKPVMPMTPDIACTVRSIAG